MDYRSAGVDIDKADGLIGAVKKAAKSTYTPGVLSGVGGFGACFAVPAGYKEPVLVSSTDGVGTKILLARELEDYSGMGFDLLAMNADDVICAGAKPLFFIDYIAVGKLDEKQYLDLIDSMARACRECGVAMIGGETAELPGMYPPGDFDLAGFTVGVVERSRMLDSKNVREGDSVIGLLSSGFHSNGFSLVRKVVETAKLDLRKDYGFGELGKKLLTPTKLYCHILAEMLDEFPGAVRGIAHITGGGIPGNLNRALPGNLDARIDTASWETPAEMKFIVEQGGIAKDESYKVFNMGIGMGLICDSSKEQEISGFLRKKGAENRVIGKTVPGNGKIVLV
ncbi:MAG: phosphoribosylformylglycinamidine cyclo-ligase [Spirochaetes bacterium GWF1_51_8]|nr:MAG: phosphoribosylformylglycinamidine cyclo-ligase [Spirochaetes bacterium GWF1_51_8]